MPTTRKRANSPVEAAEDMEEQEFDGEAGAQLQFGQPLTWRAGKPIAVAELLRRLETLSQELQTYDQDEVERGSLLKVARELASQQLLSHKDRGVKAWTACCLVDMFRLCAPDAPYTGSQLKDIFTLFVQTIFPALADPSSPYNGQHLFVLKSLAEVKSIVLLTDIPASANIIETLFKECFDVLGGPVKGDSGEELSKNVEHHMTAVLATLVDESQGLSNETVHTILAQFLRTSPKIAANGATKGKRGAQMEETQGTLLFKEAPPAYNMAKNICNSCPDKMARYVTRYFSAVLVDAATALSSMATPSGKRGKRRASDDIDDSDDEIAKTASQDIEESRKAHDLLRELWRSTPSVLQDIIPQLETELSAENVHLRLLAVETIGDMISGIGHAGPPTPITLNPAAYPSQSLMEASEKQRTYNFLTTPSSPVAFISRYFQTYQAWINRRFDRSPTIRAAWVTAAARIILTSAGNVGLDSEEEQQLSKYFADVLNDADEKVRLHAVTAIDSFDYDDIVQKLGSKGGVSKPGSLFFNLAARVKDRKPHVHSEAIKLLGKIWGVAVGAIGEGSERVSTLLGPIPSRILETKYINNPDINALVDRVLYESFLPLSYPPIKSKQANGHSQRGKDSQAGGNNDAADPDKLRAERILLLVRDLEPKAKTVFFALQVKQSSNAQYMNAFLQRCELYNGGVMDSDEKKIKAEVGKLIDAVTKDLPEPSKAAEDLWKFAKMHDRRSYQLIRFCMAADSDYRKVKNSINELTKRIEEAAGSTTTLLETLVTLVYRASILVYNRSHVPAIIEFSRTDEKGLGHTAHEILKEISKHKSEVFKAHVQDLCKSLESEAPSSKKTNSPGAVDDLKACAAFARQFPNDIPKERKFTQAMLGFVVHGAPPEAAKYGALILLTSADKKEMYAKDIFEQCAAGFKYGSGNFLTRLAALSQLMLLGPQYLDSAEADSVVDIAITKILTNPEATPEPEEGEPDPEWTDEVDDNCAAKIWALKILVNRLRAYAEDDSAIDEATRPVFQFLNTLVQKRGQVTTKRPSLAAHRSRLRLVAAQLLLKLCCESRFSHRLSSIAFNSLATVAMDPNEHIRSGFVKKIMKYLGQGKLTKKFYTPLFLLGHEPIPSIKDSAITWLKSRATSFARAKDTSMESIFARLISLLAHHPDWTPEEEIETEAEKNRELVQTLTEFMGFIVFYLRCVATRDNLSLIFHIAQRIKAVQDGVVNTSKPDGPELLKTMNERLYMLSDLSQGVIKQFGELNGWIVQAWPGKVSMPGGIFGPMPDHDTAQSVAMKNHLPADLAEDLDDLVRDALKTKKRKSENAHGQSKKRAKTSEIADRRIKKLAKSSSNKTPKKKRTNSMMSSDPAAPSSATRRSSRATLHKSYVEISDGGESEGGDEDEDDDEDEEMKDAPDATPKATPEPEQEEEPQSSAGAEPSSDKEDVEPEEQEGEKEKIPRRSSDRKHTPRKQPTPKKPVPVSTKKSVAATPKKSNANGVARKEKAIPLTPKAKAKATAKETTKAKTNGRPTRSTRSTRGKEKDMFDVPSDSDG